MRRLLRLWQTSGSDLRMLLGILRSPTRPQWFVPAAAALALFAIDPFNFAIPFLGVIDDVILLPLLLRWLVRAASMRDGSIVASTRSTSLLNAPRR